MASPAEEVSKQFGIKPADFNAAAHACGAPGIDPLAEKIHELTSERRHLSLNSAIDRAHKIIARAAKASGVPHASFLSALADKAMSEAHGVHDDPNADNYPNLTNAYDDEGDDDDDTAAAHASDPSLIDSNPASVRPPHYLPPGASFPSDAGSGGHGAESEDEFREDDPAPGMENVTPLRALQRATRHGQSHPSTGGLLLGVSRCDFNRAARARR